MRIAILGTGKIGESLLAGLRSSDWADIVASSRREERAVEVRDRYGVETTTSNAEAIKDADVVVLAVKPQDVETLLGEIGHLVQSDQTVLSVAAAITTARIERHLAGDVPVVRPMPNAPASVNEGIAGMTSAPARAIVVRFSKCTTESGVSRGTTMSDRLSLIMTSAARVRSVSLIPCATRATVLIEHGTIAIAFHPALPLANGAL